MASRHGAEVLVASNRGPVSYTVGEDGALRPRRGGGGLVSGLSAIGPEANAVWVCAALGDGDRAVPDLQTPEGSATGLWGRAVNLVSAVVLDEEGSVKTWALAAGIIIIVLIALGIIAAATKRARRKRRKNARMSE